MYPRSTPGKPQVYPRYTPGQPQVYPRYTPGLPRVYPGSTPGESSGSTLGIPQVSPKYTRGKPLPPIFCLCELLESVGSKGEPPLADFCHRPLAKNGYRMSTATRCLGIRNWLDPKRKVVISFAGPGFCTSRRAQISGDDISHTHKDNIISNDEANAQAPRDSQSCPKPPPASSAPRDGRHNGHGYSARPQQLLYTTVLTTGNDQ